jgi:hypothetical protein
MRKQHLLRWLVVSCLVIGFVTFLLPVRAAADTIASSTDGVLTNFDGYFGDVVTTPTGKGWNGITFNFVDASTSGPAAFGTLFVLTQEYLGTPTALNSSTAGFLGASTGISGGMYDFASSVTLLPNTMYWFYSNADIATGAILGGFGADLYYAPTGADNFTLFQGAGPANFTLAGTPVPEPTTMTLLGVGIALAALKRKRTLRNKTQ